LTFSDFCGIIIKIITERGFPTMDIKAKIEELVDKVKNDKDFASDFKSNPVKAVEKVIGVDLPDEKIESIIDGVKAKISLDDAKDKIGDLFDKFKK